MCKGVVGWIPAAMKARKSKQFWTNLAHMGGGTRFLLNKSYALSPPPVDFSPFMYRSEYFSFDDGRPRRPNNGLLNKEVGAKNKKR